MDAHVPVLLEASMRHLAVKRGGAYVDLTVGMGGHARAILEQLGAEGRLIARDRDGESLERARANLAVYKNVTFEQGTFSTLASSLENLGIGALDGLLADLGASLYQLTSPERGFSFSHSSDLDMRMDRSMEGPAAADIVNCWPEQDIARILWELGEERRSRKIARAILRARPVRSTQSLASIIEQAAPRVGRLHPATRTFQALRMAVNQELEEIDSLLEQMPRVLRVGARAVVISFHSGEDRRVKRKFQELARSGRATLLTRHVVTPEDEEIKRNPASRSAKLRALEMN